MNFYFEKKQLRENLEAKFDGLYDKAIELLNQYNPCQIQKIGDKISCGGNYNGPKLCCGSCRHLSPTGCKADKPLACRLWLCPLSERKLSSDIMKKLNDLRYEAQRLGFWVFRGEKEESIKNAMVINKRKLKLLGLD